MTSFVDGSLISDNYLFHPLPIIGPHSPVNEGLDLFVQQHVWQNTAPQITPDLGIPETHKFSMHLPVTAAQASAPLPIKLWTNLCADFANQASSSSAPTPIRLTQSQTPYHFYPQTPQLPQLVAAEDSDDEDSDFEHLTPSSTQIPLPDIDAPSKSLHGNPVVSGHIHGSEPDRFSNVAHSVRTLYPLPQVQSPLALRDSGPVTLSRKRKQEVNDACPPKRVALSPPIELHIAAPPPSHPAKKPRCSDQDETGRILGVNTMFYLEPQYKCPVATYCDHSTYNPARDLSVPIRERIKHIPRCATDKKFHCPMIINGVQCSQTTTRSSDFLRHLAKKDHLPPSHFCSCGEVFTRNDALKRHVNRTTNSSLHRPVVRPA